MEILSGMIGPLYINVFEPCKQQQTDPPPIGTWNTKTLDRLIRASDITSPLKSRSVATETANQSGCVVVGWLFPQLNLALPP